jgi:transcription-repair coupling factor (superfamily II helicase)
MTRVRGRIQECLGLLLGSGEVGRIASAALVRDRDAPVTVSGLAGTARALFVASLWEALQRPILFVSHSASALEVLASDIAWCHSVLNDRDRERVAAFPAWETDPYSGLDPHTAVQERRASALWRLGTGRADILVTSPAALVSRLPSPEQFETLGLRLKVGDEVSPELMLEHLSATGYIRQEPVGGPGEFSSRGGIVDIFSPLMSHPARLEFFGDTIDSIREFDLEDQRSRNPVNRIEVVPISEQRLAPDLLRRWAGKVRQELAGERLPADMADKLALADAGEPFPGARFLLPATFPMEGALPDYLESALVVRDEPDLVRDTMEAHLDTLRARHAQSGGTGFGAVDPSSLCLSVEDLESRLARLPSLNLQELHGSGDADADFLILGQPARRFHGRMREMAGVLEQSFRDGRHVVLLGSTLGMAERLRDVLHEYEVPCRVEFGDPTLRAIAEANAPLVGVGRLSEGFRLPDLGLELFAETDVLDEAPLVEQTRPRRRSQITAFLSNLEDLKPGDFVVHVDHGIGKYDGLTRVHERDCMIVTYQEGDRLYVPLERLDLIQKYSASEGHHPRLDRLGGTTWAQRKTRVRKAIRDMAGELLELYARRRITTGYAFSPDSEWQQEFADAFQHEETPDQIRAIDDIRRDMESETPMDRLVCGDVGYGKTEVAMRAAFKAAADGKQVAVLAPTTVLCFQHFETFRERFQAFPVRIAMLSRFVPRKEQRQVVEDLGAGKIDVLVGTHRLLSADVVFSDLGLLVVDEEQRFGVAHKERIKQIRKQVDVLTMTATPIPRTLHMALTGLRDMSVIETPPRDRLSIQTSVVKFSTKVIADAIRFELDRGGQVYFVHNRIESIYSLADFVRRNCPGANVGVGHGQMGERELERVMLRFMRHEFEVLVSTTIIENGLDIPLANTLIVNRADRFGLAQLYQLRGRVGRSSRRAYAYLLIPPDQTLTPIARRRLAAIREFSELGAGFRIAALDLELRGAGNLLGGAQHGHIEAIGFDLYCQMLERAVEELRTGEAQPEVETSISLGVDLHIPDDFESDQAQRLRLYKSIASARTDAEVDSQFRDLEDRFGELPSAVRNLLEYARLRVIGRAMGIQSIERRGDRALVVFHSGARVDPDRIVQLMEADPSLSFAPPATLRISGVTGGGLIARIQNVIGELS